MADTPISPGVGTLGLAPKFQGVGLGLLTDIGALSFVGFSQDQWAPRVATLAFTGFAPSGVSPRLPLVAALAFVGLAPTVVRNPETLPLVGTLAFTGYTALLALNGPVALQLITGYGVSEESPAISGGASSVLQFITGTGSSSQPNASSGAGLLERITGTGYMRTTGRGELQFITGTGQMGTYITGVGVLMPLSYPASYSSGYATLERVSSTGYAQETLIEIYLTKAMNTRLNGVTEYQNYNFNSFAFFNGEYYAAGPGGLYQLDGATDNGADINWSMRTGQLDDKTELMKRLPEIVLGLRANGPVRVRVWKDDNVYYDYVLPATKTSTIHQQRVQPGKGMRSRYYMVELQGIANAAAEIDSLQVNMTKTTRRIG